MTLHAHGQKVLVADQDRTVLELIQIRLDVAGYHALVARSGQSALEILRNTRPAGLVLDLDLPEIDGFELLQRINPTGGKLFFPVLVIRRQLSVDDIRRALSLGAADCMTKPFSGADVLDRVGRMLKRPVATLMRTIERPQQAERVVYV